MASKPLFQGRLIAIGGNEDKVDDLLVLKRVVLEIGKSDFKIAVITSASSEPQKRGKEYSKVFTSLGASEMKILNVATRSQANDEALANSLEDVDLIFLAGGDQLRLTSILGGSKVLDNIQNRLKTGVLIAGTSAGAAVFSDNMIYKGNSEEGLLKGKVLTTTGFGFVENIVFDTHFMSRGRIGRLVQIVTTNPSCIGVGIGEDSGVVLKGDGTIEVIGSGQVIIVDGSEIVHSNITDIEHGESIAVEHVIIHSLVNGYSYNFKDRSFLLSVPNSNDKENTDD